MAKKKRNYKKEYEEYHGTATQKKRRAARGRARYAAEKAGTVKKGDKSKHVDHIDNNPENNSASNTRVVSAEKNQTRKRKTVKKKTARRKVLSRQKGRA